MCWSSQTHKKTNKRMHSLAQPSYFTSRETFRFWRHLSEWVDLQLIKRTNPSVYLVRWIEIKLKSKLEITLAFWSIVFLCEARNGLCKIVCVPTQKLEIMVNNRYEYLYANYKLSIEMVTYLYCHYYPHLKRRIPFMCHNLFSFFLTTSIYGFVGWLAIAVYEISSRITHSMPSPWAWISDTRVLKWTLVMALVIWALIQMTTLLANRESVCNADRVSC